MANFVPVDEFDLVIFGGTGDLALAGVDVELYDAKGGRRKQG